MSDGLSGSVSELSEGKPVLGELRFPGFFPGLVFGDDKYREFMGKPGVGA